MLSTRKHPRFDCHMHTPLCGHAYGETTEYVEQAAAREIGLITFTCHIPMHGTGYSQEGIRMRHSDIPRYCDQVAAARISGHGWESRSYTGSRLKSLRRNRSSS